MQKFHQIVFDLLVPASGKKLEDIEAVIEIPQELEKGDLAIPCFRWAKEEKTSPQKLADHWKEKITSQMLPKEIQKVESVAGYLNFYFHRSFLASETLSEIHREKNKYGFEKQANPQTIIIEFSSPNIAKPVSIGHLRSTNIGAALSRIFEARGWKVIRMNHLGDWGTQFGKLMSAYRRWGNAELLKEEPIHKLYKLYVKWHDEEESDSTLIEEARGWFAKLEQGDPEAKELWEWFRELTLEELKRLYTELSVEFDYYWGESFYTDRVPQVLEELKTKGISKESDGAVIVDLEEEKLSVAVLQKQDDSSLYLTRDLAAAQVRKERFDFDQMLYVVGSPQRLHFQQLFRILEMAKYDWSKTCEHVAFGHISFGDETMSTRKGNIVFLKEVLSRAQELALKVVDAKNPDLENKSEVAHAVGLAAILFADLSAKRIKDVKFSWEDILSFDGETGPYVQYTLVRTLSLLRRYEKILYPTLKPGLLEADEEAQVVRLLSLFPTVLARAEREREPFYVAQYLLQLSRTFNKFYTVHRILDAPEDVTNARIYLVSCVAEVLSSGLRLLGIPQLQKM